VRHAGFTLIEVMVALVVFGLAAMALVRLEGATIRGAALVDRTLLAQAVARNVAVEAVTDPAAPSPGSTRGTEVNGGARWNWTRTAARLGDAGAVRIDVAVADTRGQVLGRATMVRPPDRAQSPDPVLPPGQSPPSGRRSSGPGRP